MKLWTNSSLINSPVFVSSFSTDFFLFSFSSARPSGSKNDDNNFGSSFAASSRAYTLIAPMCATCWTLNGTPRQGPAKKILTALVIGREVRFEPREIQPIRIEGRRERVHAMTLTVTCAVLP